MWLSNGNLDDINYTKLIKADLPYFAAVWAPDADEDAYRLACDWVGWVSTYTKMVPIRDVPMN